MARTANRYLKAHSSVTHPKETFRAGNYLRLSVDSDYTGSDSLENQRKLAKEYADKSTDLSIVKEYIDDGKTGTNFERPAFTRMITDLKRKEINCVIVKDLSRFGREYIEAGNYIEKVFPFLGVRFISIVDRYDSCDAGCDKELLLISLKNLMHEMYARDISKKVGSTFHVKQEKKVFYRSSTIPYGYKMDESNENYCIDEPAADIVRQIFRLYSQGISRYELCRQLYQNDILTPAQYRQTGRIFKSPEDTLKIWQSTTIDRILKNPVYMGNILRHKTQQSFCEGKKAEKVPEEEQILITENHPPIVDKDIFLSVQKRLEQVKEEFAIYRMNSDVIAKSKIFEADVLENKVFCGSCKAVMVRAVEYRKVNEKTVQYKVYRCSTHRKISDCCDSRYIEEQVLCEILYRTIQEHLLMIKGLKKQLENDVHFSFEGKLLHIEHEKQRIANRKALLEQEYLEQYAGYTNGELTANEFCLFRSSYADKKKSCDLQEKELETEERKIRKNRTSIKRMFTTWMALDGETRLTEAMIHCCIERIEVFQDKRIDIRLSYQDCFAMLEKWTEGGK